MSKQKTIITTIKDLNYDVNSAEIFINEWKNFAFYISCEHLKKGNYYFGFDLMRSAALEGCLTAYQYIKERKIKEKHNIRGVVRMQVKRCFWDLATMFGYIPSRGQVFFPTSFIDYDSHFQNTFSNQDFREELDRVFLKMLFNELPDKKRRIFELYFNGYNFTEIGKMLGYKDPAASRQVFYRSIEEIKSPKKEEKMNCVICGKEFIKKKSDICSKRCSKKKYKNKCRKQQELKQA